MPEGRWELIPLGVTISLNSPQDMYCFTCSFRLTAWPWEVPERAIFSMLASGVQDGTFSGGGTQDLRSRGGCGAQQSRGDGLAILGDRLSRLVVDNPVFVSAPGRRSGCEKRPSHVE